MGFPSNDYIQRFIRDRRIDSIRGASVTGMTLVFDNGESLRLNVNVSTERVGDTIEMKRELIATPFAVNGEVKQSTRI